MLIINRLNIVLIIIIFFIPINATFAQNIRLFSISKSDCIDYNQAVFSKSKNAISSCLLYLTDKLGNNSKAIIKLNGRIIKLFRKPKEKEVLYSNFVFKSQDRLVTVILNSFVIDSCSGEDNCDGATFSGTLKIYLGKNKRTYQVEFYRGG